MSKIVVQSKSTPKKELQLLIEGRRNGGSVRYDSVPYMDQQTGEQKGFKTVVYCPPMKGLMETAFISEGFGWSKQQSQQAAAENAIMKYKENEVKDAQLLTMDDKIQRIQQQSCAIITSLMEMQKKCVALTNLMLEVQEELSTINNKRKITQTKDNTLNKKSKNQEQIKINLEPIQQGYIGNQKQ